MRRLIAKPIAAPCNRRRWSSTRAGHLFAGRTHWMLVRKSALRLADGQQYVVLVLIDVTKRRAREERLRESEARFRSLNELSVDWSGNRTSTSASLPLQPCRSRYRPVCRSALGHTRWRPRVSTGPRPTGKRTRRRTPGSQAVPQLRTSAPVRMALHAGWISAVSPSSTRQVAFAAAIEGLGATSRASGRRPKRSGISEICTPPCPVQPRDHSHPRPPGTARGGPAGYRARALLSGMDRTARTSRPSGGSVVVSGRPAPATRRSGYRSIRPPEGCAVSAAALREGRPYVLNDYFADERTAPWWDVARTLGFDHCHPSAQAGGRVGVLNVHGSEAGFFTDALVACLPRWPKTSRSH